MEEGFESYYQLIQELLACPEGKELELLQANSDLVDFGLLLVMQWEAKYFAENNNVDSSLFLKKIFQRLIQQMGFNSVNEMYQDYLNCLMKILKAVSVNSTEEVIYPLLKNHLDKLNVNLGFVLFDWGQKTLSTVESKQANEIAIARVIFYFGNLIQQFHLGKVAHNLELAIISYQLVSLIFTQSDFPEQWAATQNNLALAYRERIRGNKAENLEQAIECFKNALLIRTQSDFPLDWAATQQNLAIAYHERIRGNKAENLEKAIEYYQDALLIRNQSDFPVQWAMTQHNLAFAYSTRIKGDKAENLEKAIEYYQDALLIRNQSDFPEQWAETQNNLALAYCDRIKGDKAENLEKAIECFENALHIYTQTDFSIKWAMAQYNLANAYRERIRGNKAENLEQAIKYCQNALLILAQTDFPIQWAMTQHNLANNYRERIRGNKAENLEQAIEYYQNVLVIYTQIDFPIQWAMTQHNLANAYCDRIREDKAENLEQAIEYYQNALVIYTQADFPVDCLRTARNLGNIHFTQSNWKLAIQTYQKAIAAIEITRNWSISDNRRQEIIADAMDVYEKMIQACINQGQVELAIETTERSRARHLVDLMASNDLCRGGDILEKYEHLQERINSLRSSSESGDNRELVTSETHWRNQETLLAEIEEITKLEAEKHDIWLQLRLLDPILAGQQQVDPISFAQIQQLIDNQSTAILCCYSTWQHTHIFILYKDKKPQVHTCAGQKIDTLHGKFLGDNWLTPYLQNFGTWQGNIPTVLEELAQRLKLDELIEKYLQGIEELIIIPHLWLHQIPFAALPVNLSPQTTLKNENLAQDSISLASSLKKESISVASPFLKETDSRGMKGIAKKPTPPIPESRQYLGDLFRLRILPSCQILNYCHQRSNLEQQNTMGIVEDASEDLPYTTYECETIGSKYNIDPSKRLQRRQATVSEYRKLASQVSILHSSHHASADSDDPLKSALILSDGNLTLGELLTPGWRKDLQNLSDVYLNNCETNFSVNKITDDLLSIATGFLCAGARSVVSTLWSVDDCASALLAIFYYDFRNSGTSRPQALQQAQQKLRNLTGKQLEEEYLEQLISNLQQQKQQALASAEAATTIEEEEKDRQIAEKISRQIQHTLPEHCKSSYPFASPFYWAGFISQGLA